jgi:hypothetical protein
MHECVGLFAMCLFIEFYQQSVISSYSYSSSYRETTKAMGRGSSFLTLFLTKESYHKILICKNEKIYPQTYFYLCSGCGLTCVLAVVVTLCSLVIFTLCGLIYCRVRCVTSSEGLIYSLCSLAIFTLCGQVYCTAESSGVQEVY